MVFLLLFWWYSIRHFWSLTEGAFMTIYIYRAQHRVASFFLVTSVGFTPRGRPFVILSGLNSQMKMSMKNNNIFNLQKWRIEYHQNNSRNTVILKLNGSRSKHWNLILKRSNDSLWTKSSGILVFTVMSSIYCIARTLCHSKISQKLSETIKCFHSKWHMVWAYHLFRIFLVDSLGLPYSLLQTQEFQLLDP